MMANDKITSIYPDAIDSSARIHPDAVIGKNVRIGPWAIIQQGAKLADDVSIGAWSLVEKDVVIGEGSQIAEHAIIRSGTQIGKHNNIAHFTSIGDAPQSRNPEEGIGTTLVIGDNNTIREYVSIHRGTHTGGGVTRIGSNNLIMSYVHIAHDCDVENDNVFINNAAISGHVKVGNFVYIGGYIIVHQFCRIGSYSFVSRGAKIGYDVLPYVMACGGKAIHAGVFGINKEGLKRRGFSPETIQNLHRAYKIIFRQGLTVEEALLKLEEMLTVCPEVQLFIDGIKQAEGGRKFIR